MNTHHAMNNTTTTTTTTTNNNNNNNHHRNNHNDSLSHQACRHMETYQRGKGTYVATSADSCQSHINTTSHRIASHRIASHRIASHRIASHHVTPHCTTSPRVTSHRITPYLVSFSLLHQVPSRCVQIALRVERTFGGTTGLTLLV